MTRAAKECDVLVIGGGPAGAAAAQLLASWGRSVVVAHRPSGVRPSLAESLPPSTRKILRVLGQLDRVENAGLYPNDGNIAEWARAARTTTCADPGYHVSRSMFDSMLRDGASSAGARVVNAVVQHVEGDDPVRVTCAESDGTTTYHARYVLDCSGRAGVIARRGMRRCGIPFRTLAIVAEWECDGWPADQRTHTTIESYSDGWAWSVPLAPARRQCTVMIDPAKFDGPARPRLRAVYHAELARAATLARRLSSGRQISAPWTCDASLYDSTRAIDGRLLLVGDAASFIEPLSSAGVKKALLSAWRASVVVNTCLGNSAMVATATLLHERRERQVYADCLRQSNVFFAEAAAAYSTPFWSARAASTDIATRCDADASDLLDEELVRDADVRHAFEQLRGATDMRLRIATTLRFEPAPAIEGREVVMRDAIVLPGGDAPLQFAAGVNLPALARLARGGSDVSALIGAYHAEIGPVPLGGLLAGLSLLVARHALVPEDSTS